jgi:hypothetical protein
MDSQIPLLKCSPTFGAGAEDEDQREAQEAAGARAQHGQGNFSDSLTPSTTSLRIAI